MAGIQPTTVNGGTRSALPGRGGAGAPGAGDSWGRSVEQLFAKGYDKYDQLLRKQFDQLNRMLGEYQRPGLLFSAGLAVVEKIITSVAGSPKYHPYWVMHQKHFELLKESLVVFSGVIDGREALDKAVEIVNQVKADSATILAEYKPGSERFEGVKNAYLLERMRGFSIMSRVQSDVAGGPVSERTLEEIRTFWANLSDLDTRAQAHCHALFTHRACLEQAASAVTSLVASTHQTAAEMKMGKTVISQSGPAILKNRAQFATINAGMIEPDRLPQVVDGLIRQVNVVINAWLEVTDEEAGHKMLQDMFRLYYKAARH